MWLTSLKIAIVEKNTQALGELIDDMPKFDNLKDMESASYLLREAAELIYTLQDETKVTMNKMKKNLEFLQATQARPTHKLDLKS
ncbi:hypothetical protein [Sulfurimonas sp.]|uniref:hypothetical protein n=1 Tax=Sulfurimonas sp. TaxID=2022749 RepID=UPI002B468DA3|nr:hypothetical protein [Sulfurimonas sp.]